MHPSGALRKQPHLQSVFDVGEYALIPRIEHEFADYGFFAGIFLLTDGRMRFAGQRRLQLTKGLRQIIALSEEFAPFRDVRLKTVKESEVRFVRFHITGTGG